MKRSSSRLFALALSTIVAGFAACESSETPGGPDGGGGGAPDAAIQLPPDAAPPIDAFVADAFIPPPTFDATPLLGPDGAVGVTCGAIMCTDQQECCVNANGGNPTFDCVDIDACPDTVFSCDGPEDCSGNACCVPIDIQTMMPGDAECTNSDACSGLAIQACHNDPDCPNNHCCPTSAGANYCALSFPGVPECPF